MIQNVNRLQSFPVDSLLVYENKYCLQVYLGNCTYKKLNKRMKDYLSDNIFED